ncbi:hypothetical protein [Lyticum sinuosum]|uniref:Uncharacterized protein n=1 Tax=Lyticum sinuosum TaxID=1332059 RepID=A0AAE4VKU7_9RICK|nr:hypothetical protein [Lyticum sinuosum]MDZ5761144.1 hypothetical protein [Lyticum sinuosum]
MSNIKNWKILERYVKIIEKKIENIQLSLNNCRCYITSLENKVYKIDQNIIQEQNFVNINDNNSSLYFGLFLNEQNKNKKKLLSDIEIQRKTEIQLENEIHDMFITKQQYSHIIKNIKKEIKDENANIEQKFLDEWKSSPDI